MKRKKAAVDAFEKAIQYGYYDYAHAKKDTDLAVSYTHLVA